MKNWIRKLLEWKGSCYIPSYLIGAQIAVGFMGYFVSSILLAVAGLCFVTAVYRFQTSDL
jgi:hypothetical protein